MCYQKITTEEIQKIINENVQEDKTKSPVPTPTVVRDDKPPVLQHMKKQMLQKKL